MRSIDDCLSPSRLQQHFFHPSYVSVSVFVLKQNLTTAGAVGVMVKVQISVKCTDPSRSVIVGCPKDCDEKQRFQICSYSDCRQQAFKITTTLSPPLMSMLFDSRLKLGRKAGVSPSCPRSKDNITVILKNSTCCFWPWLCYLYIRTQFHRFDFPFRCCESRWSISRQAICEWPNIKDQRRRRSRYATIRSHPTNQVRNCVFVFPLGGYTLLIYAAVFHRSNIEITCKNNVIYI
jgi:hypothetical protein